MKSVIATAGLFAMANAYQPLNFHWRRQNDTYPVPPVPAPVSSELPTAVSSEAPAGFTTLTVEVTEVATITSCKPTVTDCPAVSNALPQSDLEVIVVTNTVVLTEVVCPITEAESISSAVIKEHETGSLPGSTRTEPASTSALPTVPVPYPDVPLSTAPPAVTETAALPNPGEEFVTEIDDVETTATLTLTLGRGESATVVESVITTTFQTTVVKTITACPGGCDGNGNGGDYPVPTGGAPGGGSEGSSEEDDFTTTTTATTTGTKTVTVQPPSKTDEDSSPEAPEASSPVGAEGGVPGTCSGSGEQCQCPSAVTVTIPASTVYVTIGGSVPTAVADNGSGNGNGADYPVPTGTSNDESEGNSPVEGEDEDDCPADEEDVDEDDCPADDEDVEGEDEDDCPADDEEDVVVVSQTVTVEPVPYPTGANNGTQPSGAPAPTGAPIYRRFSNAN